MAARAPMAGANVRCFIKAPPTKNCRADGHKSASVIHFTPLIVMSSLQLSLGAREGILPAKSAAVVAMGSLQIPEMRCHSKGQISAQQGKAPQASQSTPKIRSAVHCRAAPWLLTNRERQVEIEDVRSDI